MDNWMDSIYAFIKGPGWFPGTPRLGDPMGVPAVSKSVGLAIGHLDFIFNVFISIYFEP